MPAIHLIHWGPPGESKELQDILDWWKTNNRNISNKTHYIPNANLVLLRDEFTKAAEDIDSQVIYFTCHGNTEGFAFSDRTLLTYSVFASWLSGMKPPGSTPIKEIIFGSCESMSPVVRIEQYMPEWVWELAGFKGRPFANDVADLAAGSIENLQSWGSAIGTALSQTTEDNFQRAFEEADKAFTYNPKKYVATDKANDVLILRRNPATSRWDSR